LGEEEVELVCCCGVRGELEYDEVELELGAALLLSPYEVLPGILIEDDILNGFT